MILGPDGKPVEVTPDPDVHVLATGADRGAYGSPVLLRSSYGFNQFDQMFADMGFAGSTTLGGGSSLRKGLDGFRLHPYVFAAARAIAVASMQAPFSVFREQEDPDSKSSRTARCGRARAAVSRYAGTPAKKLRSQTRGPIEAHPDHPLAVVLRRPNSVWSGAQLQITTLLNLVLSGSVLWALCDEQGGPVMPGQVPAEIWPIPRNRCRAVHRSGSSGPIVQWEFMPHREMPTAERNQGRATFPADAMILFGEPDPGDPLASLDKLQTLLSTIRQDFDLREHSTSLLQNNAEPGGLLLTDQPMDKAKQEAIQERWAQRHGGPANSRKIGILAGGMKYMPVGYSQRDLENAAQLDWNRSEILAVLGTPPSILGLTEFTNYATALAQRLVFWEQSIQPLHALVEETLDGSPLFATQPDSIMGLYDVTGVDALRANQADKIASAVQLRNGLGTPARVALDTVGLDVPAFEGDEEPPATNAPTTEEPPAPVPGADPGDTPASGEPEQATSVAPNIVVRTRKTRKASRHEDYFSVHSGIESRMGDRWKGWVRQQKADALRAFDGAVANESEDAVAAAAGHRDAILRTIDPAEVIPSTEEMGASLATRVRPVYIDALDVTFEFTLVDLGGIPVFEIDNPSIIAVFGKREEKLITTAPKTLRLRVVSEMQDSLARGETLKEMRRRIGRAYDVAAGHHKTLTVARTETGSFMNEVRDAMFEEQGIEAFEWSTAGDEVVRSPHKIFGESGAHPRGFNYLGLVDQGGVLHFPNDSAGPANQVINCRCLHLPAE